MALWDLGQKQQIEGSLGHSHLSVLERQRVSRAHSEEETLQAAVWGACTTTRTLVLTRAIPPFGLRTPGPRAAHQPSGTNAAHSGHATKWMGTPPDPPASCLKSPCAHSCPRTLSRRPEGPGPSPAGQHSNMRTSRALQPQTLAPDPAHW